MRKQQWIQLLQFIAVWVLVYLFCRFVVKQSFVDVVLQHRFFFIVASVSYFYYYSIEYEQDKKYELIRNVIIYGNVYLFAHVFFRPLLNISDELFVLLWLIILWFWWTTKMKSRRKYLLQWLWFVFSFFILVSGMLYFYPDKPDVEWFIASKNYELLVIWVQDSIDMRDAYIQIDEWRRAEEYEIVPWFSRILSQSCEVSYPSNRLERDEKVVIITPKWEIFWISPQSRIQIKFSWKKMVELSTQMWKVSVLSWIFDGWIKLEGDIEKLSSQQMDQIQSLQDKYKNELVSYLKDQISDSNISLANGTIMYDIDGRILRFLARMFPTSFGRNLRNYNEFMNYFSWVDEDEIDLTRYDNKGRWSTMWDMRKNMKDGFKNWKQDTYLLKKY